MQMRCLNPLSYGLPHFATVQKPIATKNIVTLAPPTIFSRSHQGTLELQRPFCSRMEHFTSLTKACFLVLLHLNPYNPIVRQRLDETPS